MVSARCARSELAREWCSVLSHECAQAWLVCEIWVTLQREELQNQVVSGLRSAEYNLLDDRRNSHLDDRPGKRRIVRC